MGNNLRPFFSVVGGKRASSSMFLLTGSGERGIMKAEQREWNVGERMATILIVEDDVSIHTMIREYLRSARLFRAWMRIPAAKRCSSWTRMYRIWCCWI